MRRGQRSLPVTFPNLVSAFHLPPTKIPTNPHNLKKKKNPKDWEIQGNKRKRRAALGAGLGAARCSQAGQGEMLLRQPWRALPTYTNLVPAWEVLQKPPVPPWDLRKLKPCDATGRDEARGACSGSR